MKFCSEKLRLAVALLTSMGVKIAVITEKPVLVAKIMTLGVNDRVRWNKVHEFHRDPGVSAPEFPARPQAIFGESPAMPAQAADFEPELLRLKAGPQLSVVNEGASRGEGVRR